MAADDRVFVTVEKYPHVNRLVLQQWGHPVQVDVVLNRARISANGGTAEILFDCHIGAHRVRTTPAGAGVVNLTCPITLDMKRDDDLDLPSAAELACRQALCCRACRRPVADLARLSKALPLPSDHWMEMSELWVCDPHTMSTMATPYGLPERPLDEAALPDVLLVGVRDLIVPAQAVVMADGARCECGHELGEAVAGGLRLWKRAIRAADRDVFACYTAATDAVAAILQQCHSRSRYLIEVTAAADDRRLYLQICNWDSFAIQAVFRVVDGRLELQDRMPTNAKRFAPVVKVLFGMQQGAFSDLPGPFKAPGEYEKLQLPVEQFDAVCDALLGSNRILPPPQRQLGDMSIGILPKLSRII